MCFISVISSVLLLTATVTSSDEGLSRYWPDISHDGEVVDLLQLLNISARSGVSQVPGSSPSITAFKLRPSFSQVQLSGANLASVLSTPSTILFVVHPARRHITTTAVLLSAHSPGRLSPWLQLSLSPKGVVCVSYRTNTSDHNRQLTSPLDPNPRGWIQIAVSISSGNLKIWVDCNGVSNHHLGGHGVITLPSDVIVYFRQEPGLKKKFLGAVEQAKILPYAVSDRPWVCDKVTS